MPPCVAVPLMCVHRPVLVFEPVLDNISETSSDKSMMRKRSQLSLPEAFEDTRVCPLPRQICSAIQSSPFRKQTNQTENVNFVLRSNQRQIFLAVLPAPLRLTSLLNRCPGSSTRSKGRQKLFVRYRRRFSMTQRHCQAQLSWAASVSEQAV